MSKNNQNVFDKKNGNRINVEGTSFPPNNDGIERLNSDRQATTPNPDLQAENLNIQNRNQQPSFPANYNNIER